MPTRNCLSVVLRKAWRSAGVVLAAAGLSVASLGPLAPAPVLAATSSGAVISNGTVMLGVNATGDLNYDCVGAGDSACPATSAGGTDVVGIRYVPNNTDATSPGCLCEGWGAADVGSGLTGWADEAAGGSTNLTPVSFAATSSTAVSVVDVTDGGIPNASMRVTQDYHASAATSNFYEDLVTIQNTGTVAFTDLRYRRAMDWDVEPTAFSEWVTIQNPGNSPQLAFSSDDGFATPDPLIGPSYIDSEAVCGSGYTGACTFTNLGAGGTYPTVTTPDDHGSLFDFSFGAVAPGTSVTFKVLYGAAASQADAMSALTKTGAEVYSLGKSDCPESGGATLGCDALAPHSGVELGLPNTFMFAFVTTNADLRITKTDSPDPVRVGQDLVYTLAVQNAGPNAAAAVQVADTLPADVTFKSVATSKGSCSGTTAITCDLGTVGNNATETVTITVTPTKVGPLSNTATVSTASADANLANNTSTTTTTVTAQSTDLAIVKTDAPDPVTVGGDITYTLDVTNNGPDAATGVTASDTLPVGVTFKSASAGCVNAAGTVTCTIGGLASGASTSATITVTTTATGPISNTATVSGAETDPVSPNNSSTTSTTVNPLAQSTLTLSKVVDNTWGGTSPATAWTLRADGPTTISGHSGDAALTNALVEPGTYMLSESGGPAGYVADPWSCTGGSLVDDQLTLTAGQSATCSITNRFVPFLAKGSFVIGDGSSQLGDTVTYWSPSWWMANSVSGGTAPASFKGFAATLTPVPPVVGGIWTTRTGASSDPPKTVPSYMAVIVTGSVSMSGSTVFGNITGIVVVKTGPVSGTGTVVAVLAP